MAQGPEQRPGFGSIIKRRLTSAMDMVNRTISGKEARPTPQFSLDETARFGYLTFRNGEVALTEEVNDGVLVDYDRRGRIMGVEIVFPLLGYSPAAEQASLTGAGPTEEMIQRAVDIPNIGAGFSTREETKIFQGFFRAKQVYPELFELGPNKKAENPGLYLVRNDPAE